MNDPAQEQTIDEETSQLKAQIETVIASGRLLSKEQLPVFENTRQQLSERYKSISDQEVPVLIAKLQFSHAAVLEQYLEGLEIEVDFPDMADDLKSEIQLSLDEHHIAASELRSEQAEEMDDLLEEMDGEDLVDQDLELQTTHDNAHRDLKRVHIEKLMPLMQPLLDSRQQQWRSEFNRYRDVEVTLNAATNLIDTSHQFLRVNREIDRDRALHERHQYLAIEAVREILAVTIRHTLASSRQRTQGFDSRQLATPTAPTDQPAPAEAESAEPPPPAATLGIAIRHKRNRSELPQQPSLDAAGASIPPLTDPRQPKRTKSDLNEAEKMDAIKKEFGNNHWEPATGDINYKVKVKLIHMKLTADGDIETATFRLSNGVGDGAPLITTKSAIYREIQSLAKLKNSY